MRRDNKKKTAANGKVGIIMCLAYLYYLLLGEKSTEDSFYLNLKNHSYLTVTILVTASSPVSSYHSFTG